MSSSTNPKMLKDFHHHTLELIPFHEDATICCEACSDEIEVKNYYRCPEVECNYSLHKFCGELPLEIKHMNHPIHPLRLFLDLDPKFDRICHGCDTQNIIKGFYYQCVECNFNIEVSCAIMDCSKMEYDGHWMPLLYWWKYYGLKRSELTPPASISISPRNTKMLKDEFHDHKLELIRLDKKADVRSCEACTQGIIDNNYYSCPEVECDYFLHQFCGELPLQTRHGLHQSHPLKLTNQGRSCDACQDESKYFYYWCKECDFDLDLICATLADRHLEHPGHPHPLTLLNREIETYCNCCGINHKGIFYQCQKCVIFWIHEDCAALGPVVDSTKHPHPLHFVYEDIITHMVIRYKFEDIDCVVCKKPLLGIEGDNTSWFLECVPCEFRSHVNCAMIEGEDDPVQEIDHEIPHLPWEDCDGKFGDFGIVGILNRKIAANDKVEKEQIIHFSHPEHELILHNEVPKVEDPYHGHQIPISTKCNGCTLKISSPFYSCSNCDFFLHKCCAFLPSSTPQHPFHEHHHLNLVQSRKTWRVEEVFQCNCCGQYCNGFCFECEDESCAYAVDVECAFLPTSIVHKAHSIHPLTLSNEFVIKEQSCCERFFPRTYECKLCKFAIHVNCAMYPGNVSHRYDHENPFKLWYDFGAVEANYYHCERCEDHIYPEAWYYHSKANNVDQLMHPRCILQREHPELFKFKSTTNFLRGDIHPHRLHLSPLIDGILNCCDSCYEISYEDVSYNCWEDACDFNLHLSCAMKLLGTNSIGVEEYPDESSLLLWY